MNHRLKRLKRHRNEVAIEAGMIVHGAEFSAAIEPPMPLELIANIAVEVDVLEETGPLETAALQNHPMVFRGEIGF